MSKRLFSQLTGRSVLRAFPAAIFFLSLSAVFLITAFLLNNQFRFQPASGTSALTFPGNKLHLLVGKGSTVKNSLVLEGLVNDIAVLRAPKAWLQANDYPLIQYRIDGRQSDFTVGFYWAKADNPKKIHFSILPWNGNRTTLFRLETLDDWEGAIVEFGFIVKGDLRGKKLVFKSLSLEAFTPRNLLLTVWSEWFAFQPWKHSTINAVRGAPKYALVSPVMASAIWAGLAMFLYLAWRILRLATRGKNVLRLAICKPQAIATIVMLFLLPWLALDTKWQFNLARQHQETWRLFAGKDHHQQHLSAEDGWLYEFAQRIAERAPFKAGERMVILRDQWRDYVRLKVMYYLLPRNIYNYGIYPQGNILRKGDLLLVLKPIKDLQYDVNSGHLRWEKDKALLADQLLDDELGSLYRVHENKFLTYKKNINHHWSFLDKQGRIMSSYGVLAGVPTQQGRDAGVVALTFDSKGRPRIRFQEWEYRDGKHTTESASVLFMQEGRHEMPDGSIWEIGHVSAERSKTWYEVKFSHPFETPPKLFMMPQDSLSDHALAVRADKINKEGFKYRLDPQESVSGKGISLPLAYLAIQSPKKEGWIFLDGRKERYRLVSQEITSRWQTVGVYEIRLQEEQSADSETNHGSESVHVLLLNNALFGQVVSYREADTVSLRMRKKVK